MQASGKLLVILPLCGFILTTSALSQPNNIGGAKPFTPGLDDMMTMLIQPRHLKLFYAGSKSNWELAAAELRDLRTSFQRLSEVMPNYLGNDVGASVQSLIEPQMRDVDVAIASASPQKFSIAYANLTAACNSCHTYMEHPFFVIKTPSAPSDTAEPNQDFGPAP